MGHNSIMVLYMEPLGYNVYTDPKPYTLNPKAKESQRSEHGGRFAARALCPSQGLGLGSSVFIRLMGKLRHDLKLYGSSRSSIICGAEFLSVHRNSSQVSTQPATSQPYMGVSENRGP